MAGRDNGNRHRHAGIGYSCRDHRHHRAQLEAEHDAAKEQEQLAEAYLVQITRGRMFPDLYGTQVTTEPDTVHKITQSEQWKP